MQIRLAVSLHGATDEVRGQIMPVNRKHPLAELTDACDYYANTKKRMMTFEYILIAGVNDALDQAHKLGALARRLHAKVNLIPYNPVDGLEWQRPGRDRCKMFQHTVQQHEVAVTLRTEKGTDINAACGQLRLQTERSVNP
jgi:23S rRNA (adenine2503-C2)-methyltransferase